ncbi:type II toxin-antitoxin system VapC family toxin [Parapedobacter sp.]|uniref:type II toxin-antitoxin system VapC family toxin n=1 Tax=Parapedobacter sp. TaxID=1958893 RepID=UPI0039C9304B
MLIYQQFVFNSTVIGLDNNIVNETIRIRKIHKIKLPDALIAATAVVNDLTLIADNEKDFLKVSGLKCNQSKESLTRNPSHDISSFGSMNCLVIPLVFTFGRNCFDTCSTLVCQRFETASLCLHPVSTVSPRRVHVSCGRTCYHCRGMAAIMCWHGESISKELRTSVEVESCRYSLSLHRVASLFKNTVIQ